MRYRASSVDDPALAPADEAAAYADPLSGVLANHVYNAQLLGRPYLLEIVEDVEIAARFARSRLGAQRIEIEGTGDAALLARVAATALPGITLARTSGGGPGFDWKGALASGREIWPIPYLVPGGAALQLSPAAPSN
jgi:hypothetical protein